MGKLSEHDALRLRLSDEAAALHEGSLVVDLHVDSIIQQRLFGYDLTREHKSGPLPGKQRPRALPFLLARAGMSMAGNHQPFFNHADFPRMRRGGYNAVGLGIHYWPRANARAWDEINLQIDYFHQLVQSDDALVQARGPHDIRRAARAGKLAAFLALEGAHALGPPGPAHARTRLDRLETLYERGVRYLTLAHFSANDAVAHSFGPGAAPDAGLTAYGRDLVRKAGEVGIIIDVAHVSPRGVLETCEISEHPVIASHTGLAGTYPQREDGNQARNLNDEGAVAVAQTGGVIGLMLAPQFLCNPDSEGRHLDIVSRHLAHGLELLERRVGDASRFFALGSDLDGWIHSLFEDMNDAADMPTLTATLLRRGISKQAVRGFLGENFLGVWERVEN